MAHLHDAKVDALVQLLEEATRATESSTNRFIEPGKDTLSRATSRRNHIIFGRRGSGKTSLLIKARSDLSNRGSPVAFVDMEQFKSHTYPDVLISVLIASLKSFSEWISKSDKHPWFRILTFWSNKSRSSPIAKNLAQIISELEDQLHSQDSADVETRWSRAQTAEAGDTTELSVGLNGLGINLENRNMDNSTESIEIVEASKRSKVTYLHRNIMKFREVLQRISKHAGHDAYLMLDDLYHIRRTDQAEVLDYFHRITKGNSAWLKIGTIRHRTNWYRHSDPPLGLKLGDDADDVDLDLTLEQFGTAKRFLLNILHGIASDCGISSVEQLMTEGAIDRLVLASGGVARDFLSIFRRSILMARNDSSDKINAEHVNHAAGYHDESKREELKRDTSEERDRLEKQLADIRDFCIKQKANCFLVERDVNEDESRDIEELVDLRLVHKINSRMTVKHNRPGRQYVAYMLDLSQYTGTRKRRELDMIEFWTPKGADSLRRAGLIYLERQIEPVPTDLAVELVAEDQSDTAD